MRNLEILIKLTTKSHLTIGSGSTEFIHSADISQLRRRKDNIKKICIPATTFKGILRTSAIQIAYFLLNNKDYCRTVDVEKLCRNCIICNIFGANNKPSKIYCEDCFPIFKDKIELKNFTQTRIERKVGKSKEGSLFTREQIPPEIEFETTLIGKNLDETEESLLFLALNNMNYCSFGNSGGLMEIRIKEFKSSFKHRELIKKLLLKMGG